MTKHDPKVLRIQVFDKETTACGCKKEQDDSYTDLIAEGEFDLSYLKTCSNQETEGEVDLFYNGEAAGTITIRSKYY